MSAIEIVAVTALVLLAVGSCWLAYEKRKALHAAKTGQECKCFPCYESRRSRRYANLLRDIGSDPRFVVSAERIARDWQRKADEAHR